MKNDHAMCIIEHGGKEYVFNGNDCLGYKDDNEIPKDGFETYSVMKYRPLMEREKGLIHHPELLKLQIGQKGVYYAAAHACAVIYELGGMDWNSFVRHVQENDLDDLVAMADELEQKQ